MKPYTLILFTFLFSPLTVFCQTKGNERKATPIKEGTSFVKSKTDNKRVVLINVNKGCRVFVDKDYAIEFCKSQVKYWSCIGEKNKEIINNSLERLYTYMGLRDTIVYDSLASYAEKDTVITSVCWAEGSLFTRWGKNIASSAIDEKKFTGIVDAEGVVYKKVMVTYNEKAFKKRLTNMEYVRYLLPNKQKTLILEQTLRIVDRTKFL